MGNSNAIPKNLVIVGEAACGKTSIISAFMGYDFSDVHNPTILRKYVVEMIIDKLNVELVIWDTPGRKEFQHMRPKSYPGADVIIICFSIAESNSLEYVTEKLFPEVQQFCPNVPILLVGNKTDVRGSLSVLEELNQNGQKAVSSDEARVVAEKINAAGYLECSAENKEGVNHIFETAVRLTLNNK